MNIDNLYIAQQFLKLAKADPGLITPLLDSVSDGQMSSKTWVVNELEKLDIELGTIFLCAGWYATLAHMLFGSNCKIDKIRSFDIDESCRNIAETINRIKVKNGWEFKAATLDVHNLKYDDFDYVTYRYNGSELILTDSANTIINTSCEHITNFTEWYDKIPLGKIVVLQTNNYTELSEHVNCSMSLIEFSEHTPMSTVMYEGELPLEKYTRFMRIGIK